jgi:hypothetical protein
LRTRQSISTPTAQRFGYQWKRQVTGFVRHGGLTPEIESALRAARVVTPGRRAGDLVPMLATVTLE